jgi:hypothetical protein
MKEVVCSEIYVFLQDKLNNSKQYSKSLKHSIFYGKKDIVFNTNVFLSFGYCGGTKLDDRQTGDGIRAERPESR